MARRKKKVKVEIPDHAKARLNERGATETEVVDTVELGESIPAKHGRTRFRRNFEYNDRWHGRSYANKQIEVIAVAEREKWVVITVIVKFF